MANRTATGSPHAGSTRRFDDRREAGRALAGALRHYAGRSDVLVLALPRGGVPVAFEVACSLDAPLDLILVRKLGVLGHEELAMGAIADGGVRVLNADVVNALRIPPAEIEAVSSRERTELERRARCYRGSLPAPNLRSRTIIVIDDGLVTGATMQAAVATIRTQHPRRLVVAVPVASHEGIRAIQPVVDELVYLVVPEPFYALSLWYNDFRQTTDDEVRMLLGQTPGHITARA